MFSVDLLDGWEMWQSGGKSFPLGGIPFRGMFITPFWGGESRVGRRFRVCCGRKGTIGSWATTAIGVAHF